jgi:hypothetical protein
MRSHAKNFTNVIVHSKPFFLLFSRSEKRLRLNRKMNIGITLPALHSLEGILSKTFFRRLRHARSDI